MDRGYTGQTERFLTEAEQIIYAMTGREERHEPALIRLQYADQELQIPAEDLLFQLLHSLPPFVTDWQSDEAQQHRMVRRVLKEGIRAALPYILRGLYGDEPPKPPRDADLITWTVEHVAGVMVANMAAHTWQLHVTAGEDIGYGREIFTVHRISVTGAEAETENHAVTASAAGAYASSD